MAAEPQDGIETQQDISTPICTNQGQVASEEQEEAPSFIRTFRTTELAEEILLRLPPSNLCRLRQVNKLFNHIISTSDPIREHCFLKALSTESQDSLPAGASRLENPFYPLLTLRNSPLLDQSDSDIIPSWKRMLLTQPSVFEVKLCCKVDWSDMVTVRNEEGVTLGDVAARGVVYGIKGSAEWVAYRDYAQIQALKEVLNRKKKAGEGAGDGEGEGRYELEDEEEGEWMERMRW